MIACVGGWFSESYTFDLTMNRNFIDYPLTFTTVFFPWLL